MKQYDEATLALLDSAALSYRDLVVVSIPGEDTIAFWNDVYPIQFPDAFPDITFLGANGLIQLSGLTQTVQDTIQSLTGIFSGLDQNVLATIGNYKLHAANVTWAQALFDPATQQLVAVDTVFQGFINTDNYIEKETAQAILECYSRSKELDRATNRYRSNADQKRRDETDEGFQYTARVATLDWGQRPVNPN